LEVVLQELADLINKKWPDEYCARAFEPGSLGVDWQRNSATWYKDDTDFYSAEFIVWGLDRLLELGYYTYLTLASYTKEKAEHRCELSGDVKDLAFTAPTRSEAIAKALLHALKSEVG
jgi:hypothetical protein